MSASHSAHAAGDASSPAAVAAGRGNDSSTDAKAHWKQAAWQKNSAGWKQNWDWTGWGYESSGTCRKEDAQWQSTSKQSAVAADTAGSAAVAADTANTWGANPGKQSRPPPPKGGYKAPPKEVSEFIRHYQPPPKTPGKALDIPFKAPPPPTPLPTNTPKPPPPTTPQSSDASSIPSAPTRPVPSAKPTSCGLPMYPKCPIPSTTVPAVAGTSCGSSPPSSEWQFVDEAGEVKERPTGLLGITVKERPPGFYDVAFFRTWKAHMGNGKYQGSYNQHNCALKYFRHLLAPNLVGPPQAAAVAADGVDVQDPMELQPDFMQVATVIHEEKGPDFHFDFENTIAWCWLEMVAQLDEDSMFDVVGDGLVKCQFGSRPNSYAHDAAHAHKKAGRDQPATTQRIYDFILCRADGTAVRLHPRWEQTKIETYFVDGHTQEVQPPSSGLGGSDGRGTFKRYKEIGNLRTMRFDHKKQ